MSHLFTFRQPYKEHLRQLKLISFLSPLYIHLVTFEFGTPNYAYDAAQKSSRNVKIDDYCQINDKDNRLVSGLLCNSY